MENYTEAWLYMGGAKGVGGLRSHFFERGFWDKIEKNSRKEIENGLSPLIETAIGAPPF